jgi:hypothetical protein
MGLAAGYGSGSGSSYNNNKTTTTGTQATSATGTSTPTYSSGQTGLQAALISALQPILSGTGYSPQVQALQTQAANQINSQYQTVGNTLNEQNAARGFGDSGTEGNDLLQTQLARSGALANNDANFANYSLNEFNTGLQDALSAAFANPGSSLTGNTTTNTNGTTSTVGYGASSGSNYGIGAGAGFTGIPNVTAII